jgi:hypothetical protein
MALTGIVNLAERLLNQSQSQSPAEQTPAATTPSAQNGSAETPVSGAASLDQFTSSNANSAQDAGLFSVNTLSLFTAAANFILGTPSASSHSAAAQGKTGNQSGGATNTPAAGTTNTAAGATANAGAGAAATAALGTLTAPTASTANVAPAPTPAAGSANATADTVASPTDAAANADSTAATTEANVTTTLPTPGTPTFIPPASITQTADSSAQLQSLNNSLAALGLSASDISTIDRIASLLNDFSPTAYTSLVEQLVAQAQSQAEQTAAATTSNTANAGVTAAAATAQQNATPQTNLSVAAPVNAGTPATASAVPNGSGGPGGGLQVQSLVLRFAGNSATTPATGATSKTNAATPNNANTLHLQDVSLTLRNNSGQSATVSAPQPSPAGNTNTRAAVA